MNERKQKKVAVVGAGVAGLTAAWLLERKYAVDLYEKNDYAGGHTRTLEVPEGPDAGTPVDTGFIVMNDRNYPLFTEVLDQLGVERNNSDMSFSFHCECTGYAYAGSNLKSLFAHPASLVNVQHWKMLFDIIRFNKECRRDLSEGRLSGCTLGEYVERNKYGRSFFENYLFPMGSAIWSAPGAEVRNFPAESFVHFFDNHGLLNLKDRPQWKYVSGGSRQYVKAMLDRFEGTVHLDQPIRAIRRTESGVELELTDGLPRAYDLVVIAAHADQALKLLEDPSQDEQSLLGAWRYQENETVLHSDAGVMPASTKVWSSWNVSRERDFSEDQPVSVTYYMNRLQNLTTSEGYFVSLNRNGSVSKDRVIDRTVFMHPLYTFDSIGTQDRLPDLNGCQNTYYCGSYFGYGFHEDAVRSAVQVAECLGVSLKDSAT